MWINALLLCCVVGVLSEWWVQVPVLGASGYVGSEH